MQRNNISFKGQKIFIRIDVHKRNWDVAIAPEVGNVKRHTQKASAKELFDFLKKHYPDLLMTVPGIGISVSMCILTEVYDIKRFHNEREFAATPIFKGIPDFRQTRTAMLRAETMSDLLTILEDTRKRLG